MTQLDIAPGAVGWFSDPERIAATRFWNGAAWTEHTRGTAPIDEAAAGRPVLPVESLGRNTAATAALVLGIVALALDLLLVPTVLAVVLGVLGLVRARTLAAAGFAPVGRARAIVGLVLAVVALPVQAAIAIPVYLHVQNEARLSAVRAGVVDGAAAAHLNLSDIACPDGPVAAGSVLDCTAVADPGRVLTVRVSVLDDRGDVRLEARR